MTQEEINTFLLSENKRLGENLKKVTDLFFRMHFIDKDVFNNAVYLNGKIYLKDGAIIDLGDNTGGTIGKTGDKIGFLGKTPVARQAAIAAPTAPGGVYAQAEAASAVAKINEIRAVLTAFGLTS